MPQPIVATMPAWIELLGGYVVRLAALDPSTGNAVSGVNVSGVVITGRDLTGGALPGEDNVLIPASPLFVPIPTDLPAEGGS